MSDNRLKNMALRVEIIDAKLNLVLCHLEFLKEKLMGVAADLKTLIEKFDAATDEIARDLEDLRTRLTNNMTDAELADVKTTIQAKIDRLNTLGQDPNNPVPPA